ncbi:MAG: hypothetical protein WCD79_15910 [Chthoniobacteraceae bacterium]
MKKSIVSVFVFLVAAVFLLMAYLKHNTTLAESKASELLPGDTVALLEVSDLQRSSVRWKETALFKIISEPEVQAFLAKPESKIPANQQMEEKLAGAQKLGAKELFVAVTTITGNIPKFVAGFDYTGDRSDAEALVSGLKTQLKTSFPAGKSDIQKYGESEIETFEFNEVKIASVFKNHWFFASDDLDLLKLTLDRLDGKADANTSLRQNAAYKTSLLKLPQSADVSWFVQPKTLADRLVTLMSVSDPNFDAKQLDGLKKIEAIAGGMKLDGEKIRDAIYVYEPGRGAEPPMARNSLAFTTPDTLLYYASVLNMSGAPRLPDPSLDSTGILRTLDSLRQGLESAGLTYADFKDSFGPEIGALVDWPASVLQPSLILTLDVKDHAKAQKFIETLVGGQAGFPAWAKQDIGGTPFYSLPQQAAGFVAVTPVLALTDKALLFGPTLESIQNAVQLGKAGGGGLEKSAGFQTAINTVAKPSKTLVYIDGKVLFEKIYNLVVNPLKIMAMFNPHANDYADLSKLPATETISKHLGPIIYSQSADADGTLMESSGPVTLSQAVFVVGVGGGIAAMPALEKQFHALGNQHSQVPVFTPQSAIPAATP